MLIAAPAAEAQTVTFTLTATGSNGDRDATAPGLQVHEGDSVTFALGFDSLSNGAVVISGANYGGTATQGQDYSGSLVGGAVGFTESTFIAASARERDTITITDDTRREGDETITLTLMADPARTTTTDTIIPPPTLTITILANDGGSNTTLAISVDDANTMEGDTAEFTVTLTAGNPTPIYPVTVNWAVSGDVDSSDHDASGGTLTFTAAGSQTIRIAIASDFDAESTEDLTVTLSNQSSGVTFANAADNAATTTIAASTLARRLTLTGPATAEEGEDTTYTVSLQGTAFANPTAVTWTITHTDTTASDFAAATGSIMFPTMTTFAISVRDDDATDATESAEAFSVQISTADADANAVGAAVQTTIGGDDDPAAREARLDAPLASAGRGVGQLAAQAVAGRLAASVSGAARANELTVAGRDMSAGAEVLAAQFLASGYATGDADLSAADLLRQSGFNLTGGDGGRGFNFWGGGDYVSAEGAHDGIDYDGDTSAFTLGIDTGWKDGLIGIAVSRSDGDVDFTVTADGSEHTLETTVTSMHPYLTRRFNRSQLWLTAGHGSGDAELNEKAQNTVIKTDVTVTTAGLGLTRAHGQLSGDISALYTRAELDAAASGGRALPKTTADSWRVAAAGQARWQRDAFSPFVDFTVRHDSGDGDTGIAGDVGGGIEWNAPTVVVRLTAATTIAAESAEESRASLTVQKSTGNFALGLNLGMDNAGIDIARLLTGEWRF